MPTRWLWRSVLLSTLVTFSAATTSAYAQPVPEIADPSLPDIAMVRTTPFGVVIYYNPFLCQQIGPAVCGYFRAHEYGHVRLGHAIRMMFPQQQEFEADCWAAQNAPMWQVQAAYSFFMSGGGSTPIHGQGSARAARLAACSSGRI